MVVEVRRLPPSTDDPSREARDPTGRPLTRVRVRVGLLVVVVVGSVVLVVVVVVDVVVGGGGGVVVVVVVELVVVVCGAGGAGEELGRLRTDDPVSLWKVSSSS